MRFNYTTGPESVCSVRHPDGAKEGDGARGQGGD